MNLALAGFPKAKGFAGTITRVHVPLYLLYVPRAVRSLVACSEIVGTMSAGDVVSVAPLMLKTRCRTYGPEPRDASTMDGTSDLDSTGRTEWTFDCLGMPPTNISETTDIANLNETSEPSAPNKADIYSVAADKRTLHAGALRIGFGG